MLAIIRTAWQFVDRAEIIVCRNQLNTRLHRCSLMSRATSVFITVSNRCLIEPASRALDGAIYCAVLGAEDENSLTSAPLIEARARGCILINQASVKGWAEAPLYTEDLACAKSLMPGGLATISRDPGIVCATALMARAAVNLPSLPLVGWRKHWLA